MNKQATNKTNKTNGTNNQKGRTKSECANEDS